MACHRFAYLNAMCGQELYKAMTDHAGKQRSVSGTNFESYIWKSEELLGPFSVHMKNRSIRNLFGGAADKLFSEICFLRYCPECLKQLFHSPIFYLPCVTHCPVHLVPLTYSCQGGSHSIGGVRILPDYFKNQLACSCCGINFSQFPFAARAAGEGQSETPVLEDVEKWLLLLRNWQFDGVHLQGGDSDNSKTIVLEAICDTMALFWKPSLNTYWLKSRRSIVHVANSQYMSDIELYWSKRNAVPLNEDIDSACKIIKSIGRHLQRKTREHCGHKGNGRLDWSIHGNKHSLLMDANCCPYCSALIQWRANAGQLLGLRAWVRHCHRPLFDFNRFFRVGYSVDTKICAEVALSSFTWFAVALARKLEAIQNSEDIILFADEWFDVSRSKHWDAYELPTYTHEFQFKGVRFKNSCGEINYFRYSLCFALNELGRCKKGDEPSRWGSVRENDIWYIETSSYDIDRFVRRYWNHFFEPSSLVG